MAGIVVINISLEGDNEVSEIYKLHRQTRWVDLEAMVRGNGTWASFTVKSLDCVILAYLIKWNSISDMCFWKLFNCHKRSCVLSCKIGSCFEQNKDKTKWRPLFTSNISRKFITIPSNNKIQRIVIWCDVKTQFMTYYKECDYFN